MRDRVGHSRHFTLFLPFRGSFGVAEEEGDDSAEGDPEGVWNLLAGGDKVDYCAWYEKGQQELGPGGGHGDFQGA